jgi:hypothetical protein
VGESGASIVCAGARLAARELIHERSSAAGVKVLLLAGDVDAMGANGGPVLCFRGDPWGVAARTVEGERPRGDSGRRKGDMRPLSPRLNDNGAGLRGLVVGADCNSVLVSSWVHKVLGCWGQFNLPFVLSFVMYKVCTTVRCKGAEDESGAGLRLGRGLGLV